MTQEDKELLLKDLCARLPYGVKCYIPEINIVRTLGTVQYDEENTLFDFWDETHTRYEHQLYLSEFKPYLFPLSSMTEEQCYKLASIRSGFQDCWKFIKTPIPLSICNFEQIEWFHKNHFDYRGLIEKGLAIDATGLNIYK